MKKQAPRQRPVPKNLPRRDLVKVAGGYHVIKMKNVFVTSYD